jgi:hypothetical protein
MSALLVAVVVVVFRGDGGGGGCFSDEDWVPTTVLLSSLPELRSERIDGCVGLLGVILGEID